MKRKIIILPITIINATNRKTFSEASNKSRSLVTSVPTPLAYARHNSTQQWTCHSFQDSSKQISSFPCILFSNSYASFSCLLSNPFIPGIPVKAFLLSKHGTDLLHLTGDLLYLLHHVLPLLSPLSFSLESITTFHLPSYFFISNSLIAIPSVTFTQYLSPSE